MPDSTVFTQDSSFTTSTLNEPVQMHCSSSRERRMHFCETWGECLMLKHSLHPQWDFITGLSFFSLVCQHAYNHSTSFMARCYLYACIYDWYSTETVCITQALQPSWGYLKSSSTLLLQALVCATDIKAIMHTDSFLIINNQFLEVFWLPKALRAWIFKCA